MEVSPAVSMALRNLAVDRGTLRVVEALSGADIPCILLKGPTTAFWLYADEPWIRNYADTDLLVPSQLVPQAVNALAGLGLVPPLGAASAEEQDGHSVVVQTEVRDLAEVDLHHSLPGVRLPPHRVWDVLAVHREPFELLGQQINCLDTVGRSVVTVLHAARNGIGDPKSTEDLRRLLAQDTDWIAVRELCVSLDVVPGLARGLSLLPEGQAVAAKLGVTDASSVEMRLRAAGAPALAYGFMALSEMPGWSARVRRVLRELWPTQPFLRVWAERGGLPPTSAIGRRGQRLDHLARNLTPAARAWWAARR